MSNSHRFTRRALAASAAMVTMAANTKVMAQTPGAESEDGFRTITDSKGDVQVPVNPQRVVVLDGPQLDACLAVGVTPVGAVTGFDGAPFPAYLGNGTEGIENVGTIGEPNLEQIINLEPDLIISSSLRHEEIYGQLSEIAPTVFSVAVSDDWRANFQLYTNALNRQTEAEEVAAAFDTRIAEFQEATADERASWSISVLRFLSDHARLYYDTSFIGTILAAADLPRPESQISPDPEEIHTRISQEQISLADGSHIFTCSYGDVADSQASDYVNSGLWSSLEAVQSDRVYWVDDDYWMVAIGYLAANKVVDDLFTYLVDGEPGEAIPL